MNDDNKNNNNHDDSFDNEDHFGHNEFEDDKYFREEERRKQENFEKYFGDVFNGAELEKGDERRYLEGNRKKNFFNSEEAKKMARILAEFGKEGYSAYYDFMMDQVYWLDEESSRKALRRMEAIREDIRQMETRYLKFKSYWFELDGNIIQLKEEVRSGRMKAEEADREAQALQAQQDKIKDDITRMFAEFEGMEKEYHQFLDIVKTSLKEAIATSKEIREFREQSRDQHGSTLKHYYEMSNFKTGMLENTSGIFGKMVSIKSLSVIMVCTILFGGAVGAVLGKTIFANDLPKYVWQADYKAETKPKFAMKLETQEQVEHAKSLMTRDKEFVKIGSYLLMGGSPGFHILKSVNFPKIEPIKEEKVKVSYYKDFIFTPTHIAYRKPQFVDAIESQTEVEIMKMNSSDFIFPERIKVGGYVVKHEPEEKVSYKYHVYFNENKVKILTPVEKDNTVAA